MLKPRLHGGYRLDATGGIADSRETRARFDASPLATSRDTVAQFAKNAKLEETSENHDVLECYTDEERRTASSQLNLTKNLCDASKHHSRSR
jgi:hypothetical protein